MLGAAFEFRFCLRTGKKGTPAAENKKADENSTEKVQSKIPDTYANDFLYKPYTPTFKTDGTKGKIKNVILLIGDGMGMAQAVAGYTPTAMTLR